MNSCARVPRSRCPLKGERGSVLLTAMLVAIVLGAGLVGYLALSFNSLRLAQRTHYLNCANHLAEAGLEEAIYAFRLVDTGTAPATAFSSWTRNNGDAALTLPTFNCGQNAIGIVKVYVDGFDSTIAVPTAIAQASITPIGGGPTIRKTVKAVMKSKATSFNAAIVTKSSMSIGNNATIRSINSNGGGGSTAQGNIISLGGSISIGNNAIVNGNVLLATGVTAPSPSQVNGSIINNYTGNYPTPPTPSWPASTGYYGITSIPSTLPRPGDVPASDGRFYYYPLLSSTNLPIGSVTITAAKNVTIKATSVGSGLILGAGATCIIWTEGNISLSGNSGWNNPNSASALQIYSLGTSVALGTSSAITACIYAPLASVSLNGGGSSPTFTGSIVANAFSCSGNSWNIVYDTALNGVSTPFGTGWSMLKWYDLQGTAESRTLASATGNFLN